MQLLLSTCSEKAEFLLHCNLRRDPNWHKARLIVERTAISSCEEEEEEEANIKPKLLDRLPFKLGRASLQGRQN